MHEFSRDLALPAVLLLSTALSGVTPVLAAETSPHFIDKWGEYGTTEDGDFNCPMGVAVDSAGHVYVVDSGNNRIQKFTYDPVSEAYEHTLTWGSFGTDDNQFVSPCGIAVDSSGNVYVADVYNNRIKKFTSGGVFLTKYGVGTYANGGLDNPWGVAVDSAGCVYVADTGNERIVKFANDGTLMTMWGTEGDDDGEFYSPTGIAVDDDGYVYVADNEKHCMQKFSYNPGDGTHSHCPLLGRWVARITASSIRHGK